MAQIPRSYVQGFVDGFKTLDDHTKALLYKAIGNLDMDMPVADVRESLIGIMRPLAYQARTTSAQLAAEFYDGLRELQIGERMGAVLYDGYSDAVVESEVRAAVTPLAKFDIVGAAEWEARKEAARKEAEQKVADALARCLGRSVRESAGNTLFRNGERDPRTPKFARVPTGSKSYPNGCPFCRMLASRGFAYRSKLTAGGIDPDHYHDGCNCAVVPAWGKGSVEGYDPDDYLDGYGEYMAQDHSRHEQNVRERQRNRYDAYGRLKSGTGERLDHKETLTEANRESIRRRRSLDATLTRRAQKGQDRFLKNVGVYESEWRAMTEYEQNALLEKARRRRR